MVRRNESNSRAATTPFARAAQYTG